VHLHALATSAVSGSLCWWAGALASFRSGRSLGGEPKWGYSIYSWGILGVAIDDSWDAPPFIGIQLISTTGFDARTCIYQAKNE